VGGEACIKAYYEEVSVAEVVLVADAGTDDVDAKDCRRWAMTAFQIRQQAPPLNSKTTDTVIPHSKIRGCHSSESCHVMFTKMH